MIKDFYPTPDTLIHKMLSGVKLDERSNVLEPSAGKGDICAAVQARARYSSYHGSTTLPVDAIEIDEDLQHILKGKGYRLVHDDFLTFETHKAYDLIIANFPFSDGDKHLSKALGMIERNGGQLVCLVNAETLRNRCTNLRQMLAGKLDTLGAEIEYLTGEFRNAERKTDVECALIRVKVEPARRSVILDELERARQVETAEHAETALVEANFLKAIVARFDAECAIGRRLIDEYFALLPYLKSSIKRKEDTYDAGELIRLDVRGKDRATRTEAVNEYLAGTRRKYWAMLINDPRFNGVYTSNILDDLRKKLDELEGFDFSLFNIDALEKDMRSRISQGIEDAILKMFDEFSRQYAWGKDFEKNIHYYNGWATNKAHKINKKVIMPWMGFSTWKFDKQDRLESRVQEKFNDICKVFNYLADYKTDVKQLVAGAIHTANERKDFNGIDFRYFDVTFYKKGTCHIRFKDERLLQKFNIFGSQRKGWLPPAYGRKSYEEMDQEERQVIDEFQGREEYAKVCVQSDYYLVENTGALALNA